MRVKAAKELEEISMEIAKAQREEREKKAADERPLAFKVTRVLRVWERANKAREPQSLAEKTTLDRATGRLVSEALLTVRNSGARSVAAGAERLESFDTRDPSTNLNGAVIDFVDTIEKQGFTIDNPNATGSCACGDSFH